MSAQALQPSPLSGAGRGRAAGAAGGCGRCWHSLSAGSRGCAEQDRAGVASGCGSCAMVGMMGAERRSLHREQLGALPRLALSRQCHLSRSSPFAHWAQTCRRRLRKVSMP